MKIGLLTPYTGGNLGDAAIQEAVIGNIRRLLPSAEICLITLSPIITSQLHCVSSFPIGMTTFSPGPMSEYVHGDTPRALAAEKLGLFSRLKAMVKRSAFLYSAVKLTNQMLVLIAARSGVRELLHITRAYRLMRGVSLLIVSGGGQLDDYWGGPWRHPYALFKWGLIAKAVGAKYVFLSVGKCSLESKVSAFFIRYALKLAAYRSYRDQVSKKQLEYMDFARNDSVYPDLAYSYVQKKLPLNPVNRNKGKIVGVSPIAYLSRYGWPKKNLSIYDRYIEALIHFVSDLIDRGHSVIFFSTDSVDRKVINEVVSRLPQNVLARANGQIHQPCTDTLDDLFTHLSNVDCVVASRLHGVLLSHLVRIPVLAISYDRKVDTYMAETGQTEYCLDIHTLKADLLIKTFQSLTTNADQIQLWLKRICDDYARVLMYQYDYVLDNKNEQK